MANVEGDINLINPHSSGTLGGFCGQIVSLIGSGVPTTKFQMRGWNSGWKTWISYGTPDPTPPISFGPCTNVTIAASWE